MTVILQDFAFLLSGNPLLAVATEGEAYLKLLGIVSAITGLIIYLSSRLFGELSIRVGLPPVLGDLIAGLIIGISGFHWLILEGNIPTEISSELVNFIHTITGASSELVTSIFAEPLKIITERNAQIGVGVLLFTIGLESDLDELIKVGGQATLVAVAGVIIPFVIGFFGLTTLFGISTIPALFAGAALTATSIGITAKVMQDLGVLKSTEGQIILGASILDDILGIVILAIVISIVDNGAVELRNIVSLIIAGAIFVIASILLSKFFGPWYASLLNKFQNPGTVFIGAIILLSVMGLLAGLIGLESILGSFAAGLILGGTDQKEKLEEMFKPLVIIFTTIFFITIGAKTDLSIINPAIPENREGLIIAFFLIVVAIVGKVAAGFFAITKEKVNQLAIGTGMIPRGEVGLVFAGLGAATGALPASLDVAIVLMVIATTFIAPPLLRVVFSEKTVDCES
jgi:Kef-type K+ transport system membrane component KefB